MVNRKTPSMTNPTDPRPLYSNALNWAHGLIAAVQPDQLTAPTPCAEFDVRALLGHLVATIERARVIGEGGDVNAMPTVVLGVPDHGWADAQLAAAQKMWPAWEDDALLDAPVTVPWGTVPGREALFGYLSEMLVHGWDLAVATGQDPEADGDVAAAALAGAHQKVPAEPRGGRIPFGPVVESQPDAGPTERLANWAGHTRP